MHLYFLEAEVPLTKAYEQHPDGLQKTPYPHVYEVTSHQVSVHTLKDFESALKTYAQRNYCLLKGTLNRPLKKESRAGTTDSNAMTEFVCLDIDGLPETFTPPDVEIVDSKGERKILKSMQQRVSVAEVLKALGIDSVSYVIQWSASYGIQNNDLRCHIFMWLDKPTPAPLVKQWLIHKNLTTPLLNANLKLTATGNSLSWPLDISTCQNDKLIYIAPPILNNILDPFAKKPRISLVKRMKDKLTLVDVPSMAKNRELMHQRLDELRKKEGLPKRKTTYRMHGSMEVLQRPDVCTVTDMKQERGFVYFNLNGGDSWAYYHPENNPDYIYNFKGEPVYLTKELIPDYWEELHRKVNTVNSDGLLKLAFLDPKSDKYWRGTYDTKSDELLLESTSSSLALRHYCKANGIPLYDDVIPEWTLMFDPHDTERVNIAERTINLYAPTEYMRTAPKKVTQIPKTIRKIIHHVCGSDQESFDYFINWLAYVLQTKDVALTAWVFHGIPGTGKGTLLTRVLRPLFGHDHVAVPRMKELEKEFNSFIDRSLLVCVDEVEVDALQNERGVMADLRRYITEQWVPLRRMHRDSQKVRNYSAWLFFSNASAPVRVPREDRRMNVAEYQPDKLEITDPELDLIPHELQAFHDYLALYKVDRDKVFTPLNNQARADMIDLSEPAIDSTSNALLEGNMRWLIDQLPTDERYVGDSRAVARVEDYKAVLRTLLERTDRQTGTCAIARDELRAIYEYTVGKIPESPNKFTSLIKHHRVRINKVWLGGKVINGIKVTWKEMRAWPEFGTSLAVKPVVKPAFKVLKGKTA